MGKLLRWDAPAAELAYTDTEVWRSSDGGATFTQCTSADIVGYTASGIPIATTFANDLNGAAGYQYKIRFYDSVHTVWSGYSTIMTAQDFRGYCTVEDVRSFSNVQTTELDDGPVQLIIDSVTAEIDLKTGRTWQGVQTVTDELYDIQDNGTGAGLFGSQWGGIRQLQLNQVDLVTLTALSVDTQDNNTFTSVTPDRVLQYPAYGLLVLDVQKHSNLEVSYFTQGRQTVKVSYTWGNADPTPDVRYLAILMVLNQMYLDPVRYNKAQSMLRNLTRRLYSSV